MLAVVKEHSSDGQEAHRGGVLGRRAEALHGNLGAHVIDVALGHIVQDGALERRRGHGIDDHALGGQLLAQRLGEAQHRRLGGGIGAGIGVAFLAGDGGDIDDAAIAGFHHHRGDGAAAIEQSVDVDVHHLGRKVDGIADTG